MEADAAMERAHPRVLIAGIAAAMRDLQAALTDDFKPIAAESYDDALRSLHETPPDLIVVAYHFDGVHPFRLIRYIRDDPRFDNVPIILVRVLPVGLGASDKGEMRKAYEALGVNEFVDLYDDAEREGREAALRRFRHVVKNQLAR
jgi:PleD family two-component response regulator